MPGKYHVFKHKVAFVNFSPFFWVLVSMFLHARPCTYSNPPPLPSAQGIFHILLLLLININFFFFPKVFTNNGADNVAAKPIINMYSSWGHISISRWKQGLQVLVEWHKVGTVHGGRELFLSFCKIALAQVPACHSGSARATDEADWSTDTWLLRVTQGVHAQHRWDTTPLLSAVLCIIHPFALWRHSLS